MRKTMRICGLFLAILMLFTLTSCAPKTAEKGKEKMEKKGYTVVTTSTDISFGSLYESKTEDVLVCSKEVDGEPCTVTVLFYKNAADAKEAYKKSKESDGDSKDYKVTRSGKVIVSGNKKAVNDYNGL